MKNFKLTYLFAVLLFFSVSSCDDDLDIDVTGSFASDLVLSTPEQVELLLLTTYNSTENWGLDNSIWWSRRFNIENASFESKFNFNNLDLLRVRAGWTAGNPGFFRNQWSKYYTYIRQANLFFDQIPESPAMEQDPEKVNLLLAEMRFLRANLYSKLIRYYGGVPILETAASLDDDFNIPRNTYEECVNFIVSELDAAAAVLPDTRPEDEFGRATKMAALAVKSRVLLYAASDLHDPALAPQTTNTDFYTYSKATKWQDASDAAKAVIDMVGSRDLISVADAKGYQDLFLSVNEDIIFARPFGSTIFAFGTDGNSLWDRTQSPNGDDGWALSSPTHNYALQYNMNDGTTTDDGLFDPADPNANREMRYYANLNFQGAEFRGNPINYALSLNPDEYPHGDDSPEGLGNVRHSSKTGYNIRKFQNESLGNIQDPTPGRPYILYRLAEIYLNYAEAQYHLGNEAEALTFVNKSVARGLQPAITAAGTDLLEAIKRERRIELAFEGHNFFDERRWMNEDHLGMDIKGLTWTTQVDGTVTNEEYTVVTRPWFQRMYYLPIPQAEIDKTASLIQNDGY
ncbi:RagB/SusD family nutrient uptake outer membrane protein [uncultured Maribacter sp.]|uniref:RagB/SusD family nutrient uptake outer membrane protein n=1 Tax=uncultured Maribacter sp. TaxID=431308 RepID=UPI0026324052|nr:RagB/SusD family nutrient uptake outer membrane protein [uncultured Maribacter sp.]